MLSEGEEILSDKTQLINDLETIKLNPSITRSGFNASYLELADNLLVCYDKYQGKVSILSENGDLLISFYLVYHSKPFNAFSYTYCPRNGLLYFLDCQQNIVIALDKSGKLVYDFSVPFYPLHIVCSDNKLYYYNPFPRNKYSNGYVLNSTDLLGSNYTNILKIKPFSTKLGQPNDISWLYAYRDTVVMYNRALSRTIEYDTEGMNATITDLDFTNCDDINILGYFPLKKIQDYGFLLAVKNELYTPMLWSKKTGKIEILTCKSKNSRLLWGIESKKSDFPFFPNHITKNGALYRFYHFSIGIDSFPNKVPNEENEADTGSYNVLKLLK